MRQIDKSAVFIALTVAVLAAVSTVLMPNETGIKTAVGVSDDLAFLAAWTIGSIPLVFAMPRLRARFFGRMWRVPSSTYLVPRWVVSFLIGAMLGQAVGYLIAGVAVDQRLFWLAGSFAIIGFAFFASAWGRLREHPGTEFAMRWWKCF